MLFRSSIIFASKNELKFENVLFGNELSAWNGTAFVAPVDGVYLFQLQITTYNANRGYRLRALINNGDAGVDQLNENTSKYVNGDTGHNHSFQIEREMKVGDTLTVIDEYAYGTLYDYSNQKCSTNQKNHSCSHFTGRLIKRLK